MNRWKGHFLRSAFHTFPTFQAPLIFSSSCSLPRIPNSRRCSLSSSSLSSSRLSSSRLRSSSSSSSKPRVKSPVSRCALGRKRRGNFPPFSSSQTKSDPMPSRSSLHSSRHLPRFLPLIPSRFRQRTPRPSAKCCFAILFSASPKSFSARSQPLLKSSVILLKSHRNCLSW